MKWRRLWQPQRLLFWQMVVFNVLSSVCSWAMRALPLNGTGIAVVGIVALANVGFGLLAAWALLKVPAPGEVQAAVPAEVQAAVPARAGSSASGSSASTASTSE